MPTGVVEEAAINAGAAILNSDNIALATVGLMLLLSLLGNVIQYRDYRSDRVKPWEFVHELTTTLQDLRVTIAGLGK